jgi:hypothetical protein
MRLLFITNLASDGSERFKFQYDWPTVEPQK